MASQRYCVEYDKRGAASCQQCKQKLEKNSVRLGKIVPNPFSDSESDMKKWFHVNCMFQSLLRVRATTKKIEDPDDLEGWGDLKQEDKDMLLKEIKAFAENAAVKDQSQKKRTPKKQTPAAKTQTKLPVPEKVKKPAATVSAASSDPSHRDNSFREFRRLCAEVADDNSSLAKTKIVSKFFLKGSDGNEFKGDLLLWLRLLLPGIIKRVYNMQSKVILKCFSQIFGTNYDDMLTDLEQGDVAETVKTFFEQSTKQIPAKKSKLMLKEVDETLEELSQLTKEEDQTTCLKSITVRCTSNDLRTFVRLIKRDLRINAGAKPILDAIHPDAYQAFQASRNLEDVVARLQEQRNNAALGNGSPTKALKIGVNLMTPVLPMLAEACRSVEKALSKFPDGMYSELKYDGERVQVHKMGHEFKYFSRSLKPVLPHKVQHLKDFISKAFPHGNDLILDSEILLVETATGKPLPFGTLGKHKKAAFQDATVCLFVFDCIHFNGENLMNRPLDERKKLLKKNMTEIPNRVMFSEVKFITKADDLKDMIVTVLSQKLEGLVLKGVTGIYEPGKRHWLKVKKDYLAVGKMIDSADLLVLGAFFGTGNNGGKMSIFLMGCLNTSTNQWCTVTKVSGGFTDDALERLQSELDMVKISKNSAKVPSWLNVNKSLIPDFVCRDPKKSQVWEIVGAEFSKAEVHTADGISIRFPRKTKTRHDKTWKEATTLAELKVLCDRSYESNDWEKVLGVSPIKKRPMKCDDDAGGSGPQSKKTKVSDDITTTSVYDEDTCSSVDSDGADIDEYMPTYFKGCQVYLPKKIPHYKMYFRHIAHYGGTVLDEDAKYYATHTIIQYENEPFSSGKPVTVDKLRNCITSKLPLP